MAGSLIAGVQSAFKASREEAKKVSDKAAADLAAALANTGATVPTEAPAKKARGMAFKAINVDDMGVITFIGGAVGDANRLDLDGEFVAKGDLITMAFDFCSAPERVFKANHEDVVKADLVQTWVGAPIIKDGDAIRSLKADEVLTKEMEVVGISTEKGAETHWFLSARPQDPELIEKAKKGDIVGGSWSASVTKTVV